MSFERGETFYYANRNTKQAEKCTVVDWICQYPMAYIAKNEASGEIFKCYSVASLMNNPVRNTKTYACIRPSKISK